MTTKTLDRTRPPAAGHRRPPGFISRWRARRAERDAWAAHHRLAQAITAEFREACTALRLCQYVSVAAGVTVRTPRVGAVHAGPPMSLSVELMAGQEPGDFTTRENGPRLAHSLGGHGLRVEPLAGRWVRVTVLNHDPLRDRFGLPSLAVASGADPVILGRTEDGITLGHAFTDSGHLGAQGQNGSGKSALFYGLLSQVAAAPDVLVTGSDITGLLLGKAWDGTAHRPHQVAGTADLQAHAVLLEDLVAEMDRRLEAIPLRRDKIEPSPETPTVLVVLEEFPGLLRAADALPKPKRGEGVPVGDRIRSAVLRLLSEGRKAAFRVLMLAQRFEATAVGGGYARDQFALRLSFRVPADSLEMLHGADARPLGPEHANAAPGIAYLSGLGRDCERIRVPYLGEYGEYVDRIQAHGRRAAS
jgi:S-DNA-T family DNA segregation ATPase FtsK/SpoIIIE